MHGVTMKKIETICNPTVSICKLLPYIRTVSTRNYALLVAAHHIESLPSPSIRTSRENLSRSLHASPYPYLRTFYT